MAHAKEQQREQTDKDLTEDEIRKRNTKIFVGGLKYTSKDDVLKEYFEKFGELEEAVVIYDRETGLSKGYGFVTMSKANDAALAIENKTPRLDGRKCNVNLAYLGQKKKMDKFNGKSRSPFAISSYYSYPVAPYYSNNNNSNNNNNNNNNNHNSDGGHGFVCAGAPSLPAPPPLYHFDLPFANPYHTQVYPVATAQGLYPRCDMVKQPQQWIYPQHHFMIAGGMSNQAAYYGSVDHHALVPIPPTHGNLFNDYTSKDINNNNNKNNNNSNNTIGNVPGASAMEYTPTPSPGEHFAKPVAVDPPPTLQTIVIDRQRYTCSSRR